MTPRAATELAQWLMINQPQVFKQLALRTAKQGQLRGITDWLSAIGTTAGTAVKSVGSFLTSAEGMATLGTIGGIYLQTQAQKDALKIQFANAQAGIAPAPIQSVGANPTTSVPVYVDPVTGQRVPLTPQVTQSLLPGMSQYLPWILGGGFLLIAVFATRR